MVKVLTNKTYVCEGLSIVSVERGNANSIGAGELDNCFVAFVAGTCPDTKKEIKLILKGKLAFFIYTNFLEDIGTISKTSVCRTTGVTVSKIVTVNFVGAFKEERAKQIICILAEESNISFDFKYII